MKTYDLIIIGGGPGGYVSAIRAGQLGMNVALVERARVGGMCLNWGCVPSRRLMESARLYRRVLGAAAFGIEGADSGTITFNWKKAVAEKDRIVQKLVKGVEFLMKKNKVEMIAGEASITGPNQVKVGAETYGANRILIATGSRPNRDPLARLPTEQVVEIDSLYSMESIPERIVIVGGDIVACEMASMLNLLGKKVTMVASQDKLVPWLDEALVKFVADRLKKDGVQILTGSQMPEPDKKGIRVGDAHVECDLVVNATRRTAVLPALNGLPLDLENGFIRINDYMQTSVPSIYAVGDVTGQIFAHVASHQGLCAVNHMSGLKETVDYRKMPVTIYMAPEISSVGATEEQLKELGTEYVKGEFPMSVNSRALAEGNLEGFVKILADKKYGEVLGVHIVAENATDLIAEAVMCMRTEGTLDDLARVVHAHPTISETVMEAGFKAIGQPIHL